MRDCQDGAVSDIESEASMISTSQPTFLQNSQMRPRKRGRPRKVCSLFFATILFYSNNQLISLLVVFFIENNCRTLQVESDSGRSGTPLMRSNESISAFEASKVIFFVIILSCNI